MIFLAHFHCKHLHQRMRFNALVDVDWLIADCPVSDNVNCLNESILLDYHVVNLETEFVALGLVSNHQ